METVPDLAIVLLHLEIDLVLPGQWFWGGSMLWTRSRVLRMRSFAVVGSATSGTLVWRAAGW
jgi:hypothetical protein